MPPEACRMEIAELTDDWFCKRMVVICCFSECCWLSALFLQRCREVVCRDLCPIVLPEGADLWGDLISYSSVGISGLRGGLWTGFTAIRVQRLAKGLSSFCCKCDKLTGWRWTRELNVIRAFLTLFFSEKKPNKNRNLLVFKIFVLKI